MIQRSCKLSSPQIVECGASARIIISIKDVDKMGATKLTIIIIIINPFAFLLLCGRIAHADEPSSNIYDFVIVGGGTAGCTLAARLSQNGNHTVLLLEAGGEPHPELEIPALAPLHLGNPDFVRIYETVPQQNAGLANNGKMSITVGRTIGGGSSVNSMMFNRGSPHDFDNWAELTKDPSWSYSSLLKYFKKSENYHGQFPSEEQHGSVGPISVSSPSYAPGRTEWLQAGADLGFPIGDPNGPQWLGYAPLEFSRKEGRRVSAYKGYLKPALARNNNNNSNLKLISHAEVNQIIFEGKRATGVKYKIVAKKKSVEDDAGEGLQTTEDLIIALASKEVIISAGAIESPALLLRSGVGPKDVLEGAKIPQIADLPVGNNLMDHPLLTLSFILNASSAAVFDPERDLTPEAWALYNTTGEGPYSSLGGLCAQCFLQSSKSKCSELPGWPDYSLWFLNSPMGAPPSLLGGPHDGPLSDLKEGEDVSTVVYVVLGRPKSRGTVRLNPENPSGLLPLVDFKYFTEPSDMEVMIEGIKAALTTFENTPSFQRLGARYSSKGLPACAHFQLRSDDYWRCYIGQVVAYGLQASGTCRMGRGSSGGADKDPEAVVDSKLRVIGFESLRVVDASIIPAIPNANLQAPVYAIAEKSAELILKEWVGRHSYSLKL